MKNQLVRVLILTAIACCSKRAICNTGDNPLQPLSAVVQQLKDGWRAYLDGKPLEEAFKPWRVTTKLGEDNRDIRADLPAEVESVTGMLLEFEVLLLKSKKPVYEIETTVSFVSGNMTLIAFNGQVSSGPTATQEKALIHRKGAAVAFQQAAEALWKALKSGQTDSILVADVQTLLQIMDPAGMRAAQDLHPQQSLEETLRQDLEKVRANIKSASSDLAVLNVDEVRVRVDDFPFVVRGKGDKKLGYVKCGWYYPPEGLTLAIKRRYIDIRH